MKLRRSLSKLEKRNSKEWVFDKKKGPDFKRYATAVDTIEEGIIITHIGPEILATSLEDALVYAAVQYPYCRVLGEIVHTYNRDGEKELGTEKWN